tara:strand:+ start:34 stop:672 length:639 start_codon:yes stop_codon:yes gene_type:complete
MINNDSRMDEAIKSEGLWANINAKKKRGEKSAPKGSKAYKAAKKAGDKLEKTKESVNELTEAPMDKRFAKEWEKNSKVLLSHIKHESKKGDRENHRELSKLSNMVQDALSVPNMLARIVGMQEGKLTEGVGGVISRNAFGSLNEGNSYYDLKVQYYEISDNHGNGGLLSTLQDIKKKADTEQMDKIGGIDAEIKIWTAIHKLFNKSKLGKIL